MGLSCSTLDFLSSVAPRGIFSCSMWDLVPWSVIEPRHPALRAQSQPLDHQESPQNNFILRFFTWLYFICKELFFQMSSCSQVRIWAYLLGGYSSTHYSYHICKTRVDNTYLGRLLLGFEIIHLNFQFSSVAQSCPTLYNPMNRSTPGLPVHHLLPEFTQTHVHRVSDAIQPFHPLLFPSPPARNPSQHQSLFQWVNSSHEVAKVLEFQR